LVNKPQYLEINESKVKSMYQLSTSRSSSPTIISSQIHSFGTSVIVQSWSNGPNSNLVLKIIKQNVKCTFFLIGWPSIFRLHWIQFHQLQLSLN